MRRLLAFLGFLAITMASPARDFDLVVYGGTPAGVMTAVAAARHGHSVALVEYHRHVGGMTASGLGKSDVENRAAVGGLFKEFADRVYRHYVSTYGKDSKNVRLCRQGYYYEPHVAERVFQEMLNESGNVVQFTGHQIREVIRTGRRVSGMRIVARGSTEPIELRAKVFADASYEGDLAAMAGVKYRVGRESRAEYDELHAGVVYQDYETRTFLAGTTGKGDGRVQAYTFRLCLTTDKANSAPLLEAPPDYDRSRYLGYIDDWKAGRLDETKDAKPGRGYYSPTFGTLVRALSMAELPNDKLDVNMNPRPLGFPFAELNYRYPEATWEERDAITAKIRNVTLGLLYFLQNDSAVPEEHRKLARTFHLAKDEFTDNQNFPWQLYVREARRIVGEYTFSESDVLPDEQLNRPPVHNDSVAAGEFPIDSFPVRRREPGDRKSLEGYILILDNITRPYQVPYRIMLPQDVDGLIVPVAVSATHVAFSTIRMEPLWMVIGQSAGVAAHLAIAGNTDFRDIPIEDLQNTLLDEGQILTYFDDLNPEQRSHRAAQFLGTKGIFPTFAADLAGPISKQTAHAWVKLLRKERPSIPRPEWNSSGELAKPEAYRWAEAVLGSGAGGPAPSAATAVSRGEFCELLYKSYLKTGPSEGQSKAN